MINLIVELQEKHMALLERFADDSDVPLAKIAELFLVHQLIAQAQKKGWVEKPSPLQLIARLQRRARHG